MPRNENSGLYVGKDVWYRPRAHEAGAYPGNVPLAAIVTAIKPNDRVNLLVIGAVGTLHPVLDVAYYDGDNRPQMPGYAEPQGGPCLDPGVAEEAAPQDDGGDVFFEAHRPRKRGRKE